MKRLLLSVALFAAIASPAFAHSKPIDTMSKAPWNMGPLQSGTSWGSKTGRTTLPASVVTNPPLPPTRPAANANS
jgi:hypothetical protein